MSFWVRFEECGGNIVYEGVVFCVVRIGIGGEWVMGGGVVIEVCVSCVINVDGMRVWRVVWLGVFSELF